MTITISTYKATTGEVQVNVAIGAGLEDLKDIEAVRPSLEQFVEAVKKALPVNGEAQVFGEALAKI